MGTQRRPMAKLVDQSIEHFENGCRKHEVLERCARLLEREKREVVARLWQWPQRGHLEWPSGPRPVLKDRLELVGHQLVTLATLVFDQLLGSVAETSVITLLMAAHQHLYQVTSSHSTIPLDARS
ncbi:hypothetical protein BH24ACT5_BH24ACT5_30480 [soil metagenome]